MKEMIKKELNLHEKTIQDVKISLQDDILKACEMVVRCIKNGNKVLLCGNGGSAADAQHIATELTGRYKTERVGLPAIAITTDTSALTAIGNDYGYEFVFSRQVEALAKKGDLLLAISTSGKSPNVIKAINQAKNMGCDVIGFSGKDGGEMNEICDLNIVIPSNDTPRIQEMHILIGHIICQAVDNNFS
ncbi:sedoheptulose 7-phosphate isomerase [Campylobacter blaseri]|uniref:Phosphoheptose isomerase n=1 Tax=Campylobacter blaseri TaxID=2042961 RepID=A0A2P8QZN7_9BACT|nr:D-sedoheptulose 7-phosphate isomerase [Campylobacter blaseri]PSM51715.1 phosphoheptose isomerase [Campylobacter blaseri]PSM53506.1 phosphoheptose isomerase [Campylobacter blaseri]QKF86312.1 sedoheptulose 7-phosphate isomerase [Campylobacter blaseri]